MKISDYTFTKHAKERILDMGVEPDEIVKCLTAPTKCEPSLNYPHCDLYSRNRITCSVERETLTVLTVLWWGERHWRMDIQGRGEYGGRNYRGSATA